jgi:transcriptional regulator with XRE-family HTH domain
MVKPKHPYLMAVGRRIRELRMSRTDETQESFAQRIGLDRSQYGKAERGEANMEILTLITIAKGLGVEVHQLLPDFDDQSQ